MSGEKSADAATVLVVESQDAVRLLVCSTLQARGHDTLEAGDGLTAWQLFSRHRDRIGCLITNFVLPGFSGSALVDLARELRPDLPVLMISDTPHAVLAGEFPELARMSFLRKPFRADDLLAIVTAMLTPRVESRWRGSPPSH
ncbi:MAG TPA: response regulator [Nitrospiraceae bacterium]